ncbi:MAG TPA: aldehyde ferredoxin oxidoreductase family protein [Firmicutes bacterium]|nr:aldehyde ferredoxin oxidoreductase family protein [Bacillota bacterium]
MFGWCGKRLWVDLCTGRCEEELIEPEELRKYLGGRGLNSALLYRLVDAETDPLSPDNPLLFGVGPATGTLVPGSGRYTVTAVSPLTVVGAHDGKPADRPCFGDSNSGGFFGAELKYCGFDQIVVTGTSKTPVILVISEEGPRILDASALWGLDTWQTTEAIRQMDGLNEAEVACIGPAGERLVRTSAIINDCHRAAAKCGLAAVMGSKKLKAIALKGSKGVPVARPDELKRVVLQAMEVLSKDFWSQSYARDGTPSLLAAHQKAGRLATRNYQLSQFEGYESISAEALRRYWTGSAACFACPLHCGHHYRVDEGEYAGTWGEGPEYVTLAGFGSKVGNSNLPSILAVNSECNRLGLDTLNTGSAIAWAMECWQRGIIGPADTDGLELEWGNHRAVIKLVRRMAYREGEFARLLGEGAYRAAQVIGRGSERYVIHSKGQDPGLSDPRAAPAWGLGYAVASRGGCHLRALPTAETYFSPDEAKRLFGTSEAVAPFGVAGKGRLVKWSEDQRAVADSLTVCKFVVRTALMVPEWLAKFYRSVTGEDSDGESLMLLGERVVNVERLFNLRQGLTRADDTLCTRFLSEPIVCGPAKGRVVELEPMLDEYYTARGWELDTGRPRPDTLRRLGLDGME